MKKIKTYIAALLLSLPAVAGAQEPMKGSLPLFIETGLKNNYDLRIVRNEERIADNNATIANAGYLPTLSVSAGYDGSSMNTDTKSRTDGSVTKSRNTFDHGYSAGVSLDWTIFDGFKIQANYSKLQELRRQGQTRTRLAIEDYVAELQNENQRLRQEYQAGYNLDEIRTEALALGMIPVSRADHVQIHVEPAAENTQTDSSSFWSFLTGLFA